MRQKTKEMVLVTPPIYVPKLLFEPSGDSHGPESLREKESGMFPRQTRSALPALSCPSGQMFGTGLAVRKLPNQDLMK